MNSDPLEQEAFAAALLCTTDAERDACLDECCGGDAALRQRVEALLRAAENAGDFLEAPPKVISGGVDAISENPGDRIGHYKLLEQIGEGGCGVVYMAEQQEPVRRRVALKVIKPGMDTRSVIARFEAERQALAMMEHANIARVFDGGATPAGRPYFVMELVRGVPITTFCDKAALPTSERLRLFLLVCQAVQHAHQKGIIHRDLKPSNILVTVNDGVPVPKVIDFGIAKATGEPLTDKSLFTQFHTFMGTPAYTSPEQAEMSSVDIDTRSDIYSLGVLLYELLTSRTPFDGEELLRSGLDEMRRVIRTEEPPRPSNRLHKMAPAEATALSAQRKSSVPELASDVRGDLDWIVMKCLEKDRTRRYETASSLASDVQHHLDHEPITARPPSQLYRFRKLLRRNKGTVAALTAIGLVLGAGLAVSITQALRAQRSEVKANAALVELRASASTYAAQARTLSATGNFAEAMEKLDYAIELRPTNAEFYLAKADILECQFRFTEAAALYRKAGKLDPAPTRAKAHLDLCEQLVRLPGNPPQEWHDTLAKLYLLQVTENLRYGPEMAQIAGLVMENIQQRFRTPEGRAGQPFSEHLTLSSLGQLSLDLEGAALVDLSPLRGLPLRAAQLVASPISDLSPLKESPLISLNISSTNVSDLAVLKHIPTLRHLSAQYGLFSDLSPLRDTRLEWLDLSSSAVTDLTLLKGKPLKVLRIGNTGVIDLEPLRGLPLRELECPRIPAVDFSVISTCQDLIYLRASHTALKALEIIRNRRLRYLYFSNTQVRDLSPLAGMPLSSIGFYDTPVTDLTPLLECPTLENIGLSQGAMHVERLRALPNLYRISYRVGKDGQPAQTAAEFWKEYDATK